jgi:hypothetical protein
MQAGGERAGRHAMPVDGEDAFAPAFRPIAAAFPGRHGEPLDLKPDSTNILTECLLGL